MAKSFGFALAVGVLLDAFIVRMVVIPSVMHCLARRRGICRAGSTGCCRTSMWRVSG